MGGFRADEIQNSADDDLYSIFLAARNLSNRSKSDRISMPQSTNTEEGEPREEQENEDEPDDWYVSRKLLGR
jgi:hypothetical protein